MGNGPPPSVNAEIQRQLKGRDAHELIALSEELAELEETPAFKEVLELIRRGREFVVDQVSRPGPTVTAEAANKLFGYVGGLKELEGTVSAIREVASAREKELEAEAASQAEEAGS